MEKDEGNFLNGKKHGEFKKIYPNGDIKYVEYEYGEKKSFCSLF